MNTPHINIQNVFDYWAGKAGKSPSLDFVMPPWDAAIYYFRGTKREPCFEHWQPAIKISCEKHREDFGFQVLSMIYFPEYYNEPLTVTTTLLSRDGSMLEPAETIYNTNCLFLDPNTGEPASEDAIFDTSVSLLFMMVFANALAHCKNVKLIDEPLTRQRKRLLKRKGGVRYKVLDIEPFKVQVRNEAAQSGETEISRAMHICRGHFATYSDERPLFGKYSGTFWKPQHVRGSKQHGVVEKDYKINV